MFREVLSACREALRDVGPQRSHRAVWRHRGHAAIEVRGLTRGGTRLADAVRAAVSRLDGVKWAEINSVTAQVLVSFEDGKVDTGALVGAVREAESRHGASDDDFPWDRPAHPADTEPILANAAALAGDLAGVAVGLGARLTGARRIPGWTRVPLVLLDTYPRLRGQLDKRIGPMATDVALAIGNSAVHAVTDGPARPVVDATYRVLVAREMLARRSAWEKAHEHLAATPEDVACDAPPERTRPAPSGPVERYADRVAAAALVSAGGVLAATRSPRRAAEALNATVPKAAYLGREGFAAVLGHDLAAAGAVPMDRSVFRRLDRVSVVVIDSGVLIGDDGDPDPYAEAVLSAARAGGSRVHVTRHPSLADLVSRVDEVADGELAGHVNALQKDGEGVLLVAAGDTAALAAADVAIGYLRDTAGRTTCWAGDIICGPGLEQVWRVLRGAGRARSVSERAVTIASAAAMLGVLESTVGNRGSAVRSLLAIPAVSTVQAASLASLTLGAVTARSVAREPLPRASRRIPWHAMSADEVLKRLEDVPSQEAQRPERSGALQQIAAELRDPLTPVLLTGSAASAMLGSPVDAALVGGVMVGNAVISGAQRLRTERALRGLMRTEQRQARRDGGQTVQASTLQPGDTIELRADDVVPADARLLEADNLEVDESALTGESLPVGKDPAPVDTPHLAERASMVYEGTTIVSGTARAVVVAVGETTEAGRASAMAGSQAPPRTGVTARLSELTSAALPATGIGGIAVTALGMLRGAPLREALSAGVAVAVAAVPEGLPLVSTVAQLSAARRLSRQGVLVRSSRSLEALGRVDVVCFDKTGTLTEGRLRVADVASWGNGDRERVLAVAAKAGPDQDEKVTHATDQAILDAASGFTAADVAERIPFANNRGFSAAIARDGSVAVKGAPEVVLNACDLGGDREKAERAVGELAGRGLRVLAVATGKDGVVDSGLTLAGFVGIADVLRDGTATVIADLVDAGIRPVVITGDHPETASAIAGSAGLKDVGAVLTGPELDAMPERERLDKVAATTVFARVTPEQKLRIVSDLRRAGCVVAMVGDGANDAAAIRLADVGIGVAARGSTAARNAADLVLSDGGIGPVGDALTEGRALWRSVQAATSILVGGNAGEVTFMVLGTALGGRSPLNTRQLLLVNMLTDMFPALAVASSEPPPETSESLGRSIAIRGGATALGATLAWGGGRLTGRAARASTMGLASVVLTQLAQTMVTGGRGPMLIATCVASAAALVIVVNTPGVSQFFGCTPLGPVAWGMVAASAAAATAASKMPDYARRHAG
jgi:cation-transporting ATPase I